LSELHLGINVGHDRAAAVVADGEILVAIEEERLDRVKHSPGIRRVPGGHELALPQRSIDYCLNALGVDESALATVTANSPGLDHGPALARAAFGGPRVLQLPSHHLAHAYSAFVPSGFDEALVFVVDATGTTMPDGRTESYSLYRADRDGLSLLHAESAPAGLTDLGTLGMLYEEVTRRIGFVTPIEGGLRHAEAGKTMGLAPHGNGGGVFGEWIRSRPGELSVEFAAYDILLELEALEDAYGGGDGPRWSRPHLVELASKAQEELEVALLHIVGEARQRTGLEKLCLAGGVALNSVANHRLVHELGFEGFFAFPAAGDAGIAAGAALWACDTHGKGTTPRVPLRRAGLGRAYRDEEIEAALASCAGDLEISRLEPGTIADRCAEALSAGRIVARFEGGAEYGPRALGHRSILADPTFARMRDVLNLRVKHREPYRPFAPVVPLDHAEEIFELSAPSPYMLLVAPVHEHLHARIPAVTHCDGTGRVQTVTAEDNPFFTAVIEQLVARRGGEPVLLNTSFNVAGEPIVETPADALRTFLAGDIDHLAIEGFWVSKVHADERTYEDHVQGLPDPEPPAGLEGDGAALREAVEELHSALEGTPSPRFHGPALDELRERAAVLRSNSFRFPPDSTPPEPPAELGVHAGRHVVEEGSILKAFARDHESRSRLAPLRSVLAAAGFDTSGVVARLGRHPQELAPTDLHYLDRFALGSEPIDQLIRLFLLRGRLGEDRCRSLFGSECFELVQELGLVHTREGSVSSAVDLYPVGDLLIATDHRYHVRSEDELDEEPVMYLGRDSIGLAMVAPRQPSASHLDLCTGSGVQALVAAGYARDVVGVDVNPRAIRFARFNASLNGIDNARFVLGDLYEPLAGRRFSSITANPPFVPSPTGDVTFRDGGADGEAVLRRIVVGALDHLEPDGRLSIVTDLVDVEGYSAKLQRWWGEGGYVAQLLTTADRDEALFSVPHAHAPFGQSYEQYCDELEAWVESYRKNGLRAVNFGFLVTQAVAGRSGNVTFEKVVHSPLAPLWERVEELLGFQHSQLCGKLGSVTLRAAEGLSVREQRRLDGAGVSRSVLVDGDPWFTEYPTDEAMLELLERATDSELSWAEVEAGGLADLTLALVEKGLLRPRVLGGATTSSTSVPQRWIRITEAASKTTPTCLSNYLR